MLSPKYLRHETLCKEYKDGGLKYVDIPKKVISLQRSWARRLDDNSFHEWKIIPVNLTFKRHHFKSFPHYYRHILLNWKKYFLQNKILAYFLKIHGIINIFKLIRNLFIWSNFLIKT